MDPHSPPQQPTAGSARPRFAYECATCGASSDNEHGYRIIDHGRGRKSTECLPCSQRARIDEDVRSTRYALALAVPAIALLVWLPDTIAARFAAAALNFIVMPTLLVIPTIAVHELGHFAVARLLGMRVHRVQIGVGHVIWQGHWGDVPIQWRRHPILGRVLVSPASRDLARLRFGLVTAAGPATHLLWILTAVWAASTLGLGGQAPFGIGPLSQGANPIVAIVWLNGLALILNLIPTRFGDMASDGAVLLGLPFTRREQIDEMVEGQWWVPAEMALAEGDLERAGALIDEGLLRAPDSLILRLLDAARLSSGGSHAAAIERLRPLHMRDGLEPIQRAGIANCLAWSLCLQDDPADQDEREALVREAERLLGETPPVLSTRGAVLLAAGRPGEAWPFLENALSKVEEIDHRASILCNLARAEHRLGLTQQAQARVAEARSLNPRNDVLPLADRELATTPQPPSPTALRPESEQTMSPGPDAGPDAPTRTPLPLPRPTGPRIPRWFWVGVPALALLWSCGPPMLESTLLASVPYHDMSAGPVSEQEQAECQEGLATLDRWSWLLDRMPRRHPSVSSWRIKQRFQLYACADDLPAARALLARSIEARRHEIEQQQLDFRASGEEDDNWGLYSSLLVSLDHHLWLVRVEDRIGDAASASATLTRADALARRIDLEFEDGAIVSRGRVAHLAAERLDRSEGPEAALAEIERRHDEYTMADAGRAQSETEMSRAMTLMNLKAELLERLGRDAEANIVWARIGRATQAAYASEW